MSVKKIDLCKFWLAVLDSVDQDQNLCLFDYIQKYHSCLDTKL